ncbi:hypothetical protein M407DRAFT_164853 [Tulasnella calospora MUT 4182]|uniref:Uncharacterized protein n=1 Tax=Tulasnella calospora MUT 4182 TaxID=1051891 RepID=A0A0C3L900_9AGAM|nr:hypothetical protein M407DRAFT_164853 [Tulasnella calospora MUT 4182]
MDTSNSTELTENSLFTNSPAATALGVPEAEAAARLNLGGPYLAESRSSSDSPGLILPSNDSSQATGDSWYWRSYQEEPSRFLRLGVRQMHMGGTGV